MKRAFISHVSEESEIALRLKDVLKQDFLEMLDTFVSADTESIAAGEEWLVSIENALAVCDAALILCSPVSIRRPWINFEAGAAWMRKIPLIPICHSGLQPRDLPMPLSLRQGISLEDADGLKRLYSKVAAILVCATPKLDFDALARKLTGSLESVISDKLAVRELNDERAIRQRINDSLLHNSHKWRTLDRVAVEAAISEEKAASILRSDPTVRFSRGKKSRKIIVGLLSRVGES